LTSAVLNQVKLISLISKIKMMVMETESLIPLLHQIILQKQFLQKMKVTV